MDILLPEEALKIAESRMRQKGHNWYRHTKLEDDSKIIGWTVHTNKGNYVIETMKLYNNPPYIRERSKRTFKLNMPRKQALEKLNKWLAKQD